MRIASRLKRLLLVPVCTLVGCDTSDITLGRPSDPVASVGIALGFPGYLSDAFLTVGDKDTVRAQAYTGNWPSFTKYDSSIDPRRFTYSSSNEEVASITADGVIETHSPGTTSLLATADGVTSLPMLVTVSPPADLLLAEPESVAVVAGDKFAISVKAQDASGHSVSGVAFNVGLDTTFWAITSLPDEGSWKLQTPALLHITGKLPGRVRIVVTTENERQQRRLTTSVQVSVRAP